MLLTFLEVLLSAYGHYLDLPALLAGIIVFILIMLKYPLHILYFIANFMVIKILISMEKEIWRDVPGYDGKFRVSNQERFINLNYKAANEPRIYGMGDMIKPQKSNPYYKVSVGRRHIAFHQLVAMAFPDICGEYFEGCEVHHINGDKHDNRPENLKVVSVQEHRSLHPKSDEEKVLMKKRNAGSNNPFYGKHHTMEQREKWRISRNKKI